MEINNKYPRPELLLHGNIIKPLHGLNPRTLLGQEWWDKTRQEVYKATDYHCAACGVHKSQAKKHKWLEAHENYHVDFETFTYTCTEIVGLCHYCHNFIHSGRLSILKRQDKVSAQEYNAIMTHGLNVIGMSIKEYNEYIHNLYTDEWFPEKTGNWNKWKLVLEGKEYWPIHKSYEEWKMFYSSK